MARRINTRQIATYGLGDITRATGYKVAFPEINFYEIFTDADEIKLVQPGEIEFFEEVGSVTVVQRTIVEQQAGGGSLPPRRRKNEKIDEDDQRIRRVTRVRTYSIFSEEHVNTPLIKQVIATRSITNKIKFGSIEVTTGVNDDEEILLMLLAA